MRSLFEQTGLPTFGAILLGAAVLSVPDRAASLLESSSATSRLREQAMGLHEQALVVDGHVHITNRVFHEGIDPWKPQTTGRWDYARAKQGRLDVVVEQVYIEDPYTTYNYTVKQACRLIETFYRVLEANRDTMELALTAADVRRIVANGKMAVILALEGGFDMDGDLDVLRLFYRLGVRMVQFANHNTTNAYADAQRSEEKWKGINDHGRAVIREMNRLGIVIDISHATNAARLQIIEASRAPVVASHQAPSRFNPSNAQNLPDETLKALAAKGGLHGQHTGAGIISQRFADWSGARPQPPLNLFRPPDQDYGKYIAELDAEMHQRWTREDRGGSGYGRPWREQQQKLLEATAPLPTVEEWAGQVDYVVKLIGEDHVGLGLDLMAGGGSLRDLDATSYPRLTEALLAKGYSPKTVRKILGENWLRVLDAAKVSTATGH